MKAILRRIKYTYLYREAQLRMRLANCALETMKSIPFAFVVGCGRSGTTILGRVLAEHSKVSYRFEPYHLWAAIDYRTDIANLFHQGEGQLIMDENLVTSKVQQKFSNLFVPSRGYTLIEKTPVNVFRIGYIKALVPHAKFIHIVRNGVDVAHSIGRLATQNSYKIAGKSQMNQWWGVNRNKWYALRREGAEMGYWSDEVDCLQTEEQRGAYEWLTSLSEMERWRSELGDSVYEIIYEELVSAPEDTLGSICSFLGLNFSKDWLALKTRTIQKRPDSFSTIYLPEKMAYAFNQYQHKYNFSQQALVI